MVWKLTCFSQPHIVPPGGESTPVSFILRQTRWSSLSSPSSSSLTPLRHWLLCSAPSLHLTNPLYQLHHSQTPHRFAPHNLFHFNDTLTHVPSPPTAVKPLTCRLGGTQNHSPITRPPHLILILPIVSLLFLSFSPLTPTPTVPTPTQF